MTTRMRAGRTLGVALVTALAAVAWLVLTGGGSGVAFAECSPTSILPCSNDTTTLASSSVAPTTAPTTAAPTTAESAATQPVETTARPVSTTRSSPTSESREESATTEAPTSNPLIVSGPDPAAAGADGSPVAAKKKGEDKTGTVVALVIASLLVLAIVAGLLTYRFWRNTRPLVAHPEASERQPPTNGAGRSRRPRLTANGAEHAADTDAPLLRR